MSSYLVLARKYRPQNFDQLVGQEVLVRTLSNSIKRNSLHHAYILNGIRGVGKTTSARIIAKTINCLGEKAITEARACCVCESCRLISISRHQDVIEIDAASRTGVDDIREIISSVAYSPVSAKYKVYIIDEIHMLSNSAFNALLKTLEEPPAHVKFIFATTEIRKVPVTILSRCQRFDLRRLDEKEIIFHLKNILNQESLKADEVALELIAKSSEGSVRDSLSLLDQALAINNYQEFLSSELVEKMLNVSDRMQVIDLFEKLASGDFNASLKTFNEIYSFSSDVLQLLYDLLELTSKITSSKLIKDYSLDGYSKFQRDKILNLATSISLSSLIRFWQMFVKATNEINTSHSSKISFEMLMVRICHVIALPDLKSILLDVNEDDNLSGKNSISGYSSAKTSNELIGDILKSFEGAKIV